MASLCARRDLRDAGYGRPGGHAQAWTGAAPAAPACGGGVHDPRRRERHLACGRQGFSGKERRCGLRRAVGHAWAEEYERRTADVLHGEVEQQRCGGAGETGGATEAVNAARSACEDLEANSLLCAVSGTIDGMLRAVLPPLFAAALLGCPEAEKPPAELRPPAAVPRHGVDNQGDPLPDGAVARIGSLRFRYRGAADTALNYSPDGSLLAVVCDV